MSLALPTTAVPSRLLAGVDWRAWARPLFAIALIGVAYRTSLRTLIETMELDTPLAHLALVPAISLGLAFAVRTSYAGPDIHDRQLDWIVGVPLGVAALLTQLMLPERLSTDFWMWRLDLLSFPLFVASTLCLLFGLRTLWRYRLAVGFLFLAWPYPYTLVLERWLGRFTQLTIWGLDRSLDHISLAGRLPGSDSVFTVIGPAGPVEMNVASECSGANGLVGFLLVASAFMLIVRGSRMRKVSWLVVGATLVWLLNLVRILIIFWSAHQWGEGVAIDGFHPVIGLVVFNIAVLVMVVLMKPWGLAFGRPPRESGDDPNPVHALDLGGYAPRAPQGRRRVALASTAGLALSISVCNGGLKRYDLVSNSLGSPRLQSFASSQESPAGWSLSHVDRYDWSKRYFGKSSQWNRYQMYFSGAAGSALQANVPITIDVIETNSRSSLSNYGVEQCYQFHGYTVSKSERVNLGGGVFGGILTWTSDDTDLTWNTLYWHWAIKTAEGTRYERVTLVMNDQPTNTFPIAGGDGLAGIATRTAEQLAQRDEPTRRQQTHEFLEAFARELITQRAPAPST